MSNLIVNSLQSMSGVEDGNRDLTRRRARRGAGYRPGLRSQSLLRLFERFYTTKPDSVGMGLSICRSIVEAIVGGCARPDASRGVLSFSLRPPD
jgi:C4-dicarboxylate-specific signal transduction histidine kinase